MSQFIDSSVGSLIGGIPVISIDVEQNQSDTKFWGRLETTKRLSYYKNGAYYENKIQGVRSGEATAIPGNNSITSSYYQNLIKTYGFLNCPTIDYNVFTDQTPSQIIWQLKTSSGYLTYCKSYVENSGYRYFLCASKTSVANEILSACSVYGRGFPDYLIFNADRGYPVNVETHYFFLKENYTYQNLSVLRFGYVYEYSGSGENKKYGFTDAVVPMPLDSNFSDLNIGDYTIKEFDEEYGELSSDGGYSGGGFDNSSDAFGVPELPSVGVTTTGFINVYNPNLQELGGFANDLFPDIETPQFDDSGTLGAIANNVESVGKVIKSFADCFINQNLIQYVIDCHIVPCSPLVDANTGIKVGFKNFNYNPKKVTNDYVTVNCGALYVKEYYKNFLDYVGTKAKLFLPFVGFVDLKNEWFQDGKLEVVYNYNVIDGSFMAFILSSSSKSNLANTVVASYGGNACVHIPITGLNYSSMISGVVQGSSKVISSLTHGNPSGMLEGGTNILQAKPSVEQSNSYNSNSAYMGIRIPYLIIERPVASFSKNYPHEEGLPLNVTKKLSDVKGFTVCESIVTDNLSCTFKEKEMIKGLFKDGVIM